MHSPRESSGALDYCYRDRILWYRRIEPQKSQEIINIAPESYEAMGVPQSITRDATSMKICIRALKLQYTTSQLINEDIYTELGYTDRQNRDKHLHAKIMYLEIQSAPDGALSDLLDEYRSLQKTRVDRRISRLKGEMAPQ